MASQAIFFYLLSCRTITIKYVRVSRLKARLEIKGTWERMTYLYECFGAKKRIKAQGYSCGAAA